MASDLTVAIAAGVNGLDTAACKWRPAGDYGMVHPSGRSIARYSVYGEWRYMLWEPVDRCIGAHANRFHGPFDNVRDAMRLHREVLHLAQEAA